MRSWTWPGCPTWPTARSAATHPAYASGSAWPARCSATRASWSWTSRSTGLDPDGIRWIRGLLRSLAAGHRTVLISSHLLSELAPIADDVVVMSRGRLVAQATLAELFFDLVRNDQDIAA